MDGEGGDEKKEETKGGDEVFHCKQAADISWRFTKAATIIVAKATVIAAKQTAKFLAAAAKQAWILAKESCKLASKGEDTYLKIQASLSH